MYTVLIADDEQYIREGLREFIDWEAEAFRIVGESGDGASAYTKICDQKPDVVLCDVRMPYLDGLSLVEKVRAELSPPPVFIILSGYDDFSYAQRALRLGVSNYLLKPVQRDELLEELRHIRQYKDASEKAAGRNTWKAPALDLILRAPPPERLSEVLGMTIETASGAETCVFRYVVTEYESADHVTTLMEEIEAWFVCNGFSLARRVDTTTLDCVRVRGLSFAGTTLRDHETRVRDLCISLGIRIRVFRGPSVRGVANARESFDGLDDVILDVFYSDHQFTYRSKSQKDHGYNAQPLTRIQTLTQCIASLSSEALKRELEEIDAVLRANPVHPKTVLAAVSTFFVDALRIVADRDGSIEEFETSTGGTPQLSVSLGLAGVISRVLTYGQAAITYLKTIHSDTRNQVVRDVKLHISRHLGDTLRIKDIAGHLGLHPYYLGRLFKEQSGVTINDYVHHARVDAAKQLLVTRDAPLVDVATWVGYSDAEYFSRKFKELVGVSPRTYREQNN